jgi:hypothetical protein
VLSCEFLADFGGISTEAERVRTGKFKGWKGLKGREDLEDGQTTMRKEAAAGEQAAILGGK